jgi:hypothetical protein
VKENKKTPESQSPQSLRMRAANRRELVAKWWTILKRPQ